MDVTPHDLRNAELREAFRGYRPDEVEELLERAAVTLERMHERSPAAPGTHRQVEAGGSSGREMESVLAPDAAPGPAHGRRDRHRRSRAGPPAGGGGRGPGPGHDHRSRGAGPVVGEAQRQKYEAIVAELSARRDMLTLDIDALERVQADYRGRLRAVLERELEDLDRRAELPPPVRPELHEIDLAEPGQPNRGARRRMRRSRRGEAASAPRPRERPQRQRDGRRSRSRRRAAHRGPGRHRRRARRQRAIRGERPPPCLTAGRARRPHGYDPRYHLRVIGVT